MRLLIPQVDKARPAYGLKETALAKQYIDILNIARESRNAKKLLNYRAPTAAQQVCVGGGGNGVCMRVGVKGCEECQRGVGIRVCVGSEKRSRCVYTLV